jgi:predicted NAD/FAD-dependent oxidoreductase
MKTRKAESLVVVFVLSCTVRTAAGFSGLLSLPAVLTKQPQTTSRAGVLSLNMNKALQRPGQACSEAKSVALIGGGISGLVCAQRLKELGLNPTVFDTGKRAVGGRVSSRTLSFEPKGAKKPLRVPVDHSTQFFTATDERFIKLVHSLQASGAVAEWKGPVGSLDNGKFTPLDDSLKRWVGRGGMDAVPKALAKDLRTVIDCWVAVVDRQEETGKWRLFKDNNRRNRLSASESEQADFDYLVVAHNGKCAERLMRDAKVPSLHRLLKTKFACTPPPAGLMQLSSLWVMTFAVESSLQLPFEGAFISGHPSLCWAADNTKKLGISAEVGGVEAWTLVSSRPFGTANKVPQEAVPPEVEQRVADELLRAFETAAGLTLNSIAPVAQRLQLWGAGVPMNVLKGAPCVLDAAAQAGICGDWLVDPSVQGAALSGIQLAEAIHNHASGRESADVGIPANADQCMTAVSSAACGSFPGLAIADALPPVASAAHARRRGGGRGRGGGGGSGGGRGGGAGRGAQGGQGARSGDRGQASENRGGDGGRGKRGGGRVQGGWSVSLCDACVLFLRFRHRCTA